MSSRNSNSWVVHDLPARNPCCDFENNWVCFIWSTISSRISVSMILPGNQLTTHLLLPDFCDFGAHVFERLMDDHKIHTSSSESESE